MKKCELLAPAGGKEQYIAAVENGADAIYLGGQMMNARMSADNFDICQMERAVDYGHIRNVKTYVTMNTLVTDDELGEGLEYAYSLYKMGVDGLIIQDLGLGLAIKKSLPLMPLHLSTQGTVYNRLGVEAAKELGYDRVVLARELSIDEIRKCCQPHLLDIEVFVHGALCFCYSGQCQLSRSIGGRSANRGTCAQPCRLPYTCAEGSVGGAGHAGGGKITGGVGERSGYFLSPKDLCAIDFIHEIVGAGASSLKIEGRMKSPEYVATVVRIYRKYLDMFYQNGQYTVDEGDRRDLLQIFNRGSFTSSYLKGEYKDNIMAGDIPKHQGVFAGTMMGINKRGDIGTLNPAPGIELEKGDIFEIHGGGSDSNNLKSKSGPSMEKTIKPISGTVTFLKKDYDGTIHFGDIKGKAGKGDRVYRLISASQIRAARETFKNMDFEEGRFRRKCGVDATFEAPIGGHMKLSLETSDGSFTAEMSDFEYVVEESKVNPADENLIAEKLSKTGNTPFEVAAVSCKISSNAYIPASTLNKLRRDAFEILQAEIKRSYKREILQEFESFYCLNKSRADRLPRSLGEGMVELYFYNTDNIFNCKTMQIFKALGEDTGSAMKKIRVLIPLGEIIKLRVSDSSFQHGLWEKIQSMSAEFGFEVMYYLEHISKGNLDDLLENHFETALNLVNRAGNKIYIGNLGWIPLFSNNGVEVYGDFGLNICNDISIAAYGQVGMSKWIDSLEYGECHMGAVPLMTIEHQMNLERITDRKGARYLVKKLGATGKKVLTRDSSKSTAENILNLINESKNTSNGQGIRVYM